MSTYNIGFYEGKSKIIPYHQISSNTHLISSSGDVFKSEPFARKICLWILAIYKDEVQNRLLSHRSFIENQI